MLDSWVPYAVVLALPSLALIAQWVWWRHRLRQHGIDAAHPGCPRCLYAYEGWRATQCPECGHDVATTGVVVRPRLNRVLVLVVVGVWILVVAGISIMPVSRKAFALWRGEIAVELSPPSRAWWVTIDTVVNKRTMPERRSAFSFIGLGKDAGIVTEKIVNDAQDPTAGETVAAVLRAYNDVALPPPRPPGAPPGEYKIREERIDAYAADIVAEMRAHQAWMLGERFVGARRRSLQRVNFTPPQWTGTQSSLAVTFAGGISLLVAVVVAVLVDRRLRDGVRPIDAPPAETPSPTPQSA